MSELTNICVQIGLPLGQFRSNQICFFDLGHITRARKKQDIQVLCVTNYFYKKKKTCTRMNVNLDYRTSQNLYYYYYY